MSDPILEFKGPHSYLSNFYLCSVRFERITYPSSEHAYQAAKTRLTAERFVIKDAATPRDAKFMGGPRGIVTLREGWNDIRRDAMKRILKDKFGRNDDLCDKLMATMTLSHMLVEGNGHNDTYWGAVWRNKRTNAMPMWHRTNNGLYLCGHNWLGVLLMDLRSWLCS